MKKWTTLFIPIVLSFVFILNDSLMADTVRLVDRSLLVGKVLRENNNRIIFSNAYGTFRIKRRQILKIYKTQGFREDVRIHKRFSGNVNPDDIRRNYEAGAKKKGKVGGKEEVVETKRRYKRKPWKSGRLSFSGSWNYLFGRVGGVMPFGYGGYFAIDQGLEFGLKKKKQTSMIPGIRLEGGYIFLQKGSLMLSGFNVGGGLMWAFPSIKSKTGCAVFALMPGVAILEIANNKSGNKMRSNTLSAQALLGYQYSIGVFSVFFHLRYLYVYDKDVMFHAAGAEFGIGFHAW